MRQTAGRETRVRRLRADRPGGGRRGAHPAAAGQGRRRRPAPGGSRDPQRAHLLRGARAGRLVVYLVGENDLVGVVAPGVLVADHVRRAADPAALAARPRQARDRRRDDTWSEGPGLVGPRRTSGCSSACWCSRGTTSRADAVASRPPLLGGLRRAAAALASRAAGQGGVRVDVVIGHSVQGRPIVAWHLGETNKPKVVLIAGMHGNEPAPTAILRTLRDGRSRARHRPVGGAGVQPRRPGPRHPPQRARRRPNRNYPYHWAPLAGSYYSGPQPGLRAGDAGDDAVPGAGPAGLRAVVPPAAARRRRRRRAAGVRAPGRPRCSACRRPPSTAAASATAP